MKVASLMVGVSSSLIVGFTANQSSLRHEFSCRKSPGRAIEGKPTMTAALKAAAASGSTNAASASGEARPARKPYVLPSCR